MNEISHQKIKLTQKISGNLDLRPMGVSVPVIKDLDPDDVPVLVVALSSEVYSGSGK